MTGLVYKSTGSWYIVREEEGDRFWNARVKGKLKIDADISSSNPIAVGDRVEMAVEDEAEGTTIVKGVYDRHNYIARVSPQNRNQKHIVAANLDLAIVIATLAEPRTSTGFVDRFLISAEAYHIPVLVVVNKADRFDAEAQAVLREWNRIYGLAGYSILPVSALEPASLVGLQEAMQGKTVLLSGHSGVGKSTLINALVPDRQLRTGAVSGWSGKGQHTTTFAEMFDAPGGGRIIDTPGVKEFGLIDFDRYDLAQYFPEMRARMDGCRFHNCLHLAEPGCAVKAAVEEGSIAPERYASYGAMLDTLGQKY